MITRREVLGWCGALPFIPGSWAAPAPVSHVLYDDRAASFARVASALPGVRMRRLPTDLFEIYDELTRFPTRALAGITDPRLLFAIEGLAAHVGFRLVFLRAVHRHSLSALGELLQVRATASPVRTLHLQREALLRPEAGALFSWVFLPQWEGLA